MVANMDWNIFRRDRWPTLFGILSLLEPTWKLGRWVLTSLGDLDFVVTRFSDPGWVGTMTSFIVDWYGKLSPVVALVGLALIYWDVKRHRKQSAKITQHSTKSAPAIAPDGNTFFSSTVTVTDPPPLVGEKGIYVGRTLIEAHNLSADLVMDIVIIGFNASGRPIRVREVSGFVSFVAKHIDGQSEAVKLPTPRVLVERGPADEVKNLEEFMVIIEQRVPKVVAEQILASAEQKHAEFYFDELDIVVESEGSKMRLPVWSAITLKKPWEKYSVGRIIQAKGTATLRATVLQ